MTVMKKIFALLVSALFVVACSSKDDDPVPVVDTDVTLPALDNKSGGVYYGTTVDCSYVFKLVLKNGDDKMVCQVFNGNSYSFLNAEETNWTPGAVLNNFVFSNSELTLTVNLTAVGTCSAYLNLPNSDSSVELKTFKSLKDSPCSVYSGKADVLINNQKVSFYNSVLLLQGMNYFYSYCNSSDGARFTYLPIKKWTLNSITIAIPDYDETFDRTYVYSEDLISHFLHDSSYPEELYTRDEKLYRRFK